MRLLRWIGVGISGLLGLAVLAAITVYALSSYRMNRLYPVEVRSMDIPTDLAGIERGRHLAVAIGKCVDCHGPNLAGKVFIDDPMMGRFVGSNLTSGQGGIGKIFTDTDFERALRHGVKPDGKPMLFMPAELFTYFSDQDLGAVIAYVKSVPPVDNSPPSLRVGPVSRVLFLAGKFPQLIAAELIDHKVHPTAPHPGVTPEYGRYLAITGRCMSCHGRGLSGGQVPGTPPDPKNFPPAANLTPRGIGTWTEKDFFTALRQGKRPDGSTLNPFMPWMYTSQMTDDEIRALWAFLKTVPPKDSGNR